MRPEPCLPECVDHSPSIRHADTAIPRVATAPTSMSKRTVHVVSYQCSAIHPSGDCVDPIHTARLAACSPARRPAPFTLGLLRHDACFASATGTAQKVWSGMAMSNAEQTRSQRENSVSSGQTVRNCGTEVEVSILLLWSRAVHSALDSGRRKEEEQEDEENMTKK